MDKKEAIKMLSGTFARGLLWAFGLLAAKLGMDSISEDTATGLGAFLAAVVVAGVATFWSRSKDKKLLSTKPPKKPNR